MESHNGGVERSSILPVRWPGPTEIFGQVKRWAVRFQAAQPSYSTDVDVAPEKSSDRLAKRRRTMHEKNEEIGGSKHRAANSSSDQGPSQGQEASTLHATVVAAATVVERSDSEAVAAGEFQDQEARELKVAGAVGASAVVPADQDPSRGRGITGLDGAAMMVASAVAAAPAVKAKASVGSSLSLSASAAAAEAKAANEAMCSMKITATGSPAELAAMDRMVAASNAWAKEVRALANAGGAEAAREVELVEAAAVDMAESWQRMKNLAGDV